MVKKCEREHCTGLQALRSETLGKTVGFQAMPGCGLSCHVTNVESLIDAAGASDVDIMNMRNAADDANVTIDGVTLTQISAQSPVISKKCTSALFLGSHRRHS